MGTDLKSPKIKFILLAVFVVFMLFSTMFGEQGLLELRKLTNKQKGTLANISSIREENARLLVEIEKLKTNKRYIEHLARKEYGMVKDGEIVFLFQ